MRRIYVVEMCYRGVWYPQEGLMSTDKDRCKELFKESKRMGSLLQLRYRVRPYDGS